MLNKSQKKKFYKRMKLKNPSLAAFVGEEFINEIAMEAFSFFINGFQDRVTQSIDKIPKPLNIFKWANFGKRVYKNIESSRILWR